MKIFEITILGCLSINSGLFMVLRISKLGTLSQKNFAKNFESDQNQGQPEPFNFANVGNFVRGQLDASVNTTSNVK